MTSFTITKEKGKNSLLCFTRFGCSFRFEIITSKLNSQQDDRGWWMSSKVTILYLAKLVQTMLAESFTWENMVQAHVMKMGTFSLISAHSMIEWFTGGTIFPNKTTWTSLVKQNQIDHFSVSWKWRRSLLDFRVRPSDWLLSMATARIKLKSFKDPSDRTHYNIQYFKWENKKEG